MTIRTEVNGSGAMSAPVIKPGMKINEVIEMLGTDYESTSGKDILNRAEGVADLGGAAQFAASGFYLFRHPAGRYLMIVSNGIVTQVDEQPGGGARLRETELEYFAVERPEGDGLCSDDGCPCKPPDDRIPRGTGYLYISNDVVDMRQDARTWPELTEKLGRLYGNPRGVDVHFGAGVVTPILMCGQAVQRRGIDPQVAAADAKYWWETGLVPLRPTPMR